MIYVARNERGLFNYLQSSEELKNLEFFGDLQRDSQSDFKLPPTSGHQEVRLKRCFEVK